MRILHRKLNVYNIFNAKIGIIIKCSLLGNEIYAMTNGNHFPLEIFIPLPSPFFHSLTQVYMYS